MKNTPPQEQESGLDREIDIGKSFFQIFSLHTWEVPRNPLKNVKSLKNIDPKLLGYYILYGNLEDWLTIANMDDAPVKYEELLDHNLFPYFLHLDRFKLPTLENTDLRVLRDFVIQRLQADVKMLIRRSGGIVSEIINNK